MFILSALFLLSCSLKVAIYFKSRCLSFVTNGLDDLDLVRISKTAKIRKVMTESKTGCILDLSVTQFVF